VEYKIYDLFNEAIKAKDRKEEKNISYNLTMKYMRVKCLG